MEILKLNFIVFQCLGLWRPLHWASDWKTKLYDSYTWLMVFLVSTVTLSAFIELILSMDNVEAFANNSFMLLTMFGVCGKITNILMKREELIGLTNVLQRDPCQAQTIEESEIQRRFDRLSRFITLNNATLAGAGVIAVVVISIVQDVPRRTLLFKARLPFNRSTAIGFSIAYLHQIIALIAGASINVAFDTLVPGFMIHTCGQLNILRYRVKKVPKTMNTVRNRQEVRSEDGVKFFEGKMLAECVKHHLKIFEFAKTSNDVFNFMIFLQYTVSSIVLCVSAFHLSKLKLASVEFTSGFIYLTCMSMQIFIMCFYGCEVTFQSLKVGDAIYEMDWSLLSLNTKRSLLTVMTRTLRPIKFTSGHVITLNLDSFKSLLKLSYSVFNVMQQSSK